MSDYKLIRTSKARKRTTIRINHHGEVEVRTPRWTPKLLIDHFVRQQHDWIQKQLKDHGSMPKLKLESGAKLPFFGQEFPLQMTTSDSRKRINLKFMGDHFWASLPSALSEEDGNKGLVKSITFWYRKQGYFKLRELTQKYCDQLGVSCNQIRLKDQRSRWGSCSTRGNINYNWRLALAPLSVANYVVVHECCHLVHPNHSRQFWLLVKSIDPRFNEHRRWLKDNHHQLLMF
jgi:predicted metal-dependent hydrolase